MHSDIPTLRLHAQGGRRDDAEPVGQRAHLLPGFDEVMLGYKDRSAALVARQERYAQFIGMPVTLSR